MASASQTTDAVLAPEHPEALADETRVLLPRLAAAPWSEDFYLAGSAALALYLGHRPARDLDLMTASNRLASADRRDLLAALLEVEPGLKVETARDGYLATRTAAGVAVRCYHYPYPLAAPEERWRGMTMASALDLGLMKLGAVISRGGRRDFVDLYLLCRRLPLAALLAASPDKYGHVEDFPLQALKGLADLSAADGEPMPRLARPLAWAEVEAWVVETVRTQGREQVGLS